MNNFSSGIDLNNTVKKFNRKLIESNPSMLYVQREYRYYGLEEKLQEHFKSGLKLKLELREGMEVFHTAICSNKDKFTVRMVKINLN